MKLSVAILATLVTALASPALGITCQKKCGGGSSWCAQPAINNLLDRYGCIAKPDSVFIYDGGMTEVQHPNSPCRASVHTPSGVQIYMECSKLREELEKVRSVCIDSGNGMGEQDDAINYFWRVSTCGSSSVRGRRSRRRVV